MQRGFEGLGRGWKPKVCEVCGVWSSLGFLIGVDIFIYIIYIYIWVFPKIMVLPKSSILIGFSIINHPFWVPLFLETSILCILNTLE